MRCAFCYPAGAKVSAQLRFFPLPRPLIDRLGREFFRSAPREPGVYIMRGEAERILYIGQSKNLRTRLAFYKNANPDRVPRRLTRLVHEVETISYERCPSPAAARARELELLRQHRPKFNRADTGPQLFHFVEMSGDEVSTTVRLHFNPPTTPDEEAIWRGPFRGRMIPAQGLVALQRMITSANRQARRCAELPMFAKRVDSVMVSWTGVAPFFRGESFELVPTLLDAQASDAEAPLKQLLESDAEVLLSWARLLAEL